MPNIVDLHGRPLRTILYRLIAVPRTIELHWRFLHRILYRLNRLHRRVDLFISRVLCHTGMFEHKSVSNAVKLRERVLRAILHGFKPMRGNLLVSRDLCATGMGAISDLR